MASRPPDELPPEMPEDPAPDADTPKPLPPDNPTPDPGTNPWIEGL